MQSALHSASTLAAALARAVYEPNNGSAVATVGELTAGPALGKMLEVMMAEKEGRRLLLLQPRITDATLDSALQSPAGTFGASYAQFMVVNRFKPGGRPPVQHIPDPTLAYVITRYREIHDFVHVITGCGRSVDEEIAVKLLEWHHTGLPLGLLSVVGGLPHLQQRERSRLWSTTLAWAADNAPSGAHVDATPLSASSKRAVRNILTVPWEDMLAIPHDEVLNWTGLRTFPR